MSVQVPFSSSCTDSSSAPDRGHGVPRNWPYSDEYASAYRSVYSDMNAVTAIDAVELGDRSTSRDRKSTRLNSSHANISYAVLCLKKQQVGADSPLARWN